MTQTQNEAWMEKGAEQVARKIRLIVKAWIDHYPEDVFPPISTDDHTEENKGLITRVSAHMGRHMGNCLLEQIDNLMEENDAAY